MDESGESFAAPTSSYAWYRPTCGGAASFCVALPTGRPSL